MTQSYPVNEVFQTIQGEGSYTGTPSVFIRLQVCPVGCAFCDTKHTWYAEAEDEVSAGDVLLNKGNEPSAKWAALSVEQITSFVMGHLARHVVITGGEPCLYDLGALTEALIGRGCSVQIETSGTQPVRVHPDTWVTVSPKLAQPGGLPVLRSALERANEIKMPVGKPADVVDLHEMLDLGAVDPAVRIYLAPLSLSRKATELCIAAATANGYRVSLQIHALMGWR